MYNKILVPLDGSKLAECVLDHLPHVASGDGASEVVLVSVTEKVNVRQKLNRSATQSTGAGFRALSETGLSASGQVGLPVSGTLVGELPEEGPSWTQAVGKMFTQADRYLHRIQRQLIKNGITNIKTSVLCSNDVAQAIVDYAAQSNADLILMASHGRSGVSRWASGSVADKVFRATCVPLLLVRAPGCVPGIG